MSTKTTLILSLILIGAALAAGIFFWDKLPAAMASHWDVNDQVNGTMPKFWGVFMMPLVSLGMLALFLALPNIDPLKANIAQFRPAFNLFILLILAFLLYMHGLTLAWSLGSRFQMSSAMMPFLGLIFIAIGWMLRQAKRNFFIGIRTPWTLSSDTVWDKTHQLGSILFMISGALAMVGGIIGGTAAFWLMFIPLIGSTLFLFAYSYVLYSRETRA